MQKQQAPVKDLARKSKWVWAMVGLFATIFVVNYGFFSVAMSTTSGLVTEKYYKYGLQQNKFDKQYRDQKERGWNVDLKLADQWNIHEPATLSLHITDAYAQPISGGRAEVTAYRPSDAKADVAAELIETKQSGMYQASLTLPMQGVWDINILFSKGDEKYMLNQRISVYGDGNAEPSMLEKIVQFVDPQ
ncbi:MAG: FixH family protein [Ghiorsea sp.]